jgi:hypothetical protein
VTLRDAINSGIPKARTSYDRGPIRSRVSSMMGARGSVVVEALCYKPEGRGDRVGMILILPAALWPRGRLSL